MNKWEKNTAATITRERAGGKTAKGHGDTLTGKVHSGRLSDALEPDSVSIENLTENMQNPFEPLEEESFAALVSDIEKNGVLVPVLARLTSDVDGVRKGEIIDGHNRYRAAKKAGLAKVSVLFAPASMSASDAKRLAFTLQHNRRNESQAGLIKSLAQIYPEYFRQKDTRGGAKGHGGLLEKIAVETHISERTLKRYKETLHKAGGADAGKAAIENARASNNVERRKQAAGKPKSSENTRSDSTGKAQSSAAGQGRGQGRGDGKAAQEAFLSSLNNALTSVEFESAKSIKALADVAKAWLKFVELENPPLNEAAKTAKAWLKVVERKQRAAERVK